jgi:hypothetical protein
MPSPPRSRAGPICRAAILRCHDHISRIDLEGKNHFFMPITALLDWNTDVSVVRFDPREGGARETGEFWALADWLNSRVVATGSTSTICAFACIASASQGQALRSGSRSRRRKDIRGYTRTSARSRPCIGMGRSQPRASASQRAGTLLAVRRGMSTVRTRRPTRLSAQGDCMNAGLHTAATDEQPVVPCQGAGSPGRQSCGRTQGQSRPPSAPFRLIWH